MVHRPKYDDWSFPKGKLDAGEHPTAAAVREVEEETGLQVRLGPALSSQRYRVARRMKTVQYWVGRAVGNQDTSGFQPNAEVDRVAWVGVEDAADLLSYDRDRETLAAALRVRRGTHAVVVLRHGRAYPRGDWRGPDAQRPLLPVAATQTGRLIPVLAAYDVTRVFSSPSLRCVQTVQPFVAALAGDLDLRPELSEEHVDPDKIAQLVDELFAQRQGALLCTHRPVLPEVYAAAGVSVDDTAARQGLAEVLVLHVRKERVVAVERHRPVE